LKPNILFLLLDSLRSDRIYGKYKTVKSPNIDYLINNGVYFTQAITSSDYTGPSIQSMFSARFPFGTGESKDVYYKIYSKNTSYLTVLKNNGYHAYAILEIALKDQGFFEPFENDDIAHEFSLNLYNGLGEKIIKKLEPNVMKEPWFYNVHLMDLHKPCVVPENLSHLSLNERYERNINQIDNWIEKILKKIDLKKTLIVLTTDHGEYISPYDTYMGKQDKSGIISKTLKKLITGFFPKSMQTGIHVKKKSILTKLRQTKMKTSHEKRMLKTRTLGHRMLFDDIIHVPLLFAGYGIKPTTPIQRQVGVIDIFPTILELIGIPNTNENVHGRSLLPLINGKDFAPIPLYIESSITKTSIKEPKPAIGIRTENYKYFRNLNNPKENVQLYNLKEDPLEDHNIANSYPDKIIEFEQILNEIRKDAKNNPETEELTAEEEKELEQELRKLGYI